MILTAIYKLEEKTFDTLTLKLNILLVLSHCQGVKGCPFNNYDTTSVIMLGLFKFAKQTTRSQSICIIKTICK